MGRFAADTGHDAGNFPGHEPDGVTANAFGPNADCTRVQIMTCLYRCAKSIQTLDVHFRSAEPGPIGGVLYIPVDPGGPVEVY